MESESPFFMGKLVLQEKQSKGGYMRYGAMNFPVRPALQELQEIAALGFHYIELAMHPPQSHHSLLKRQRKQLLNALQEGRMEGICHLPAFVILHKWYVSLAFL